MLDRRQNFNEVGKALVVLAISPLFVSMQEQPSIVFFEPRARSYWRCQFWKKKMN